VSATVPTIAVVCSWCGADMGRKPWTEATEGVTHGICPACIRDMEARLYGNRGVARGLHGVRP